MDEATNWVLAGIGPRLAGLRTQRGTTLAALGRATGISVSTLSRLESGRRRATLELLLPIAKAHGVALDDLVGTRPAEDPRVRGQVIHRDGMTMWRLSRSPGQPVAYQVLFPASRSTPPAEGATHEGYEWLYVLAGRLRIVLGNRTSCSARARRPRSTRAARTGWVAPGRGRWRPWSCSASRANASTSA